MKFKLIKTIVLCLVVVILLNEIKADIPVHCLKSQVLKY